MTNNGDASPKKKQRIGTKTALSSTIDRSDSPRHGGASSRAGKFNDAETADVILRLQIDPQYTPFDSSAAAFDDQNEVQVYLHSRVLLRSKYFAALLSDRWNRHIEIESSSSSSEDSVKLYQFKLTVPDAPDSVNHYLSVLQMLYSDDLLPFIDSVNSALNLLPIALELLFEDCVSACVKFLEAVPWSDDEEIIILNLIPILGDDESKELIARVSPAKCNSSEQMLNGLIRSAIYTHPNMASAKAFVAKLLRDFSSKESARKVLDTAFENCLSVVKKSLDEYSSPDLRGDHDETEALQRLNLHTAMTNGKHLLWLVERMIELRVADTAVKVWSDQASFTADLVRAFRDDAWKNLVPSLPAVVLRCTSRLANAVVTGNILVARQVRLALVREWLPVLIICKDSVPHMGPNHKSLYIELEETFLKIISTLPMSDAQSLLQQCLSFSSRNVDDCPHLVAAFNTWFRRANRTHHQSTGSE